jgi:inhibitor of KinA
MEITPLGDSALIVRVHEDLGHAPGQSVGEVLQMMRRIEAAQIPGIIELAPAYTTIAVYFEPCAVMASGVEPDHVIDWLTEQLNRLVRQVRQRRRRYVKARSIEVPVCFDEEFAFDLERVAQQANLAPAELLDLYCAATYRVGCIGFTPGFPFLLGLPDKLATPRRATPRKEVPAGSVGIGGKQTGIYPLRSPGGWNVIGRTPLKLFDPEKNPPALLRVGDRVQVRAITREEFESLKS